MQKRILIVGLFLLSGMAKGHPIAEDGYLRSYGHVNGPSNGDASYVRVGCLDVVVSDVKKKSSDQLEREQVKRQRIADDERKRQAALQALQAHKD